MTNTAADTTLPVKGDRIELVDMPDDPDPIPFGTKGTVLYSDEKVGQIGVKWDNGRTLFLLIGVDSWKPAKE